MKIGPAGETPAPYQVNLKGALAVTIKDVAAQLKAQVQAGEKEALIILQRGLKLRLRITPDHQYQLTLWRDHATPSDMEVSIVRTAFDVPTETPGAIFLRWPMTPQLPLFDPTTGEIFDDQQIKVTT